MGEGQVISLAPSLKLGVCVCVCRVLDLMLLGTGQQSMILNRMVTRLYVFSYNVNTVWRMALSGWNRTQGWEVVNLGTGIGSLNISNGSKNKEDGADSGATQEVRHETWWLTGFRGVRQRQEEERITPNNQSWKSEVWCSHDEIYDEGRESDQAWAKKIP